MDGRCSSYTTQDRLAGGPIKGDLDGRMGMVCIDRGCDNYARRLGTYVGEKACLQDVSSTACAVPKGEEASGRVV